jgi:hypothetical protein
MYIYSYIYIYGYIYLFFGQYDNVIYINISRSVTSHFSVSEKTLVSGILHAQICVIRIHIYTSFSVNMISCLDKADTSDRIAVHDIYMYLYEYVYVHICIDLFIHMYMRYICKYLY